MDWKRVWQRLTPGRTVPAFEGYDDLRPWSGRPGFYVATQRFPAEPEAVELLLRVVADSDEEGKARLPFVGRWHAKLESPYLPRACDLGMRAGWLYLALHIVPPVRGLGEADVDGIAAVRHVAEALSYLHEHGLAHRAVSEERIVISGSGMPVLFDLWWIGRLKADRMVASVIGRRPREACDPPEADEEHDGVRADVYGLGVLAAQLGVPDRYQGVVERMKHPTVAERPSSMEAVLRELTP